MALTGLSLSRSHEIDMSFDPDSGTDKATKFQIGTLDRFIQTKIQDESLDVQGDPASGNVSTSIRIATANLQYVRFGLKDWRNFMDPETGQVIPFKTKKEVVQGRSYDVVADECLERLDMATITELGRRIQEANSVSETEAKNSE